jgi:transcriptional regulator with XRE-family HTH domain
MKDINFILADDIELIKEQLQTLSIYNFSEDLAKRMKKLALSQLALAARLQVSHATIGKWLKKNAKPHSKERFKELGMALGMDERQINIFLSANCYPRLYMKNPLDAACRFVLSQYAGNENVVKVYKDFLSAYKYDTFALCRDPADISTSELSRDLGFVKSVGELEAWLKNNSDRFRAYDKSYIPHNELVRFTLLYIGRQTINDMYITGELPIAVKNFL